MQINIEVQEFVLVACFGSYKIIEKTTTKRRVYHLCCMRTTRRSVHTKLFLYKGMSRYFFTSDISVFLHFKLKINSLQQVGCCLKNDVDLLFFIYMVDTQSRQHSFLYFFISHIAFYSALLDHS